jgi:hypothetical protein
MKHTLIAAVILAWGYGQWSNFQGYKPREGYKKGTSLIADVLIRPG